MATTSVKSDPIKSDRMKFQTQLVNGKPQIFFDAIDDSTTKTNKSKRTSRTMSNASRAVEQQKSKSNNQKPLSQNGTNRQTHKNEQNARVDEDGSSLGVYMTMDELAELVKAVKENAKNDNHKTTEVKDVPVQQQNEVHAPPVVPKLDLPVDPPAPPPPAPVARVSPREQALSVMAEKKRQKWMRDKAEIERMQLEIEYDQLKHQLSPRHKKTSVSPERSTFQYDFPPQQAAPVTNKPPPAPPLPSSFKQNEFQHDVSPKVNEDPNLEALKTRLMEKKQQQWKQENSEKMPTWNPFGRPGAGAPNPNENSSHISQPYSNNTISYRPPPSQLDNSSSSQPPVFAHSDQTHVPAAMRRNLFFGDVRFDDDVKTAKEIERRQWLDDLQKQIEENKRKRFSQYDTTDRRQDFLNENVQPIVQEAANRQQQISNSSQDPNRFQQHDALVQQTYEKMLEANNTAKNEKRLQLIEKLKRSGHQTDHLVNTLMNGKSTNETTGEKLFGPMYESALQQNHQMKYDQAYLNTAVDEQHSYRPLNMQRDETVNTVDSTFRSEHTVPPHRQTHPYAQDDSELPPQVPNPHYQNSGYRNVANQPGKNNVRMRSHDDANSARRTSTTTYQSNGYDDGHVSQISSQRSHHGPVDIHNRPLWNYNNREHREYIPNSKRDPHYERRQRLKHFEQGNFDRIDDVQKKTCYNRWNSDTDLQQRKKSLPPTNRVRSTISKTSNPNSHKDESILNLLKLQNKHQQESFGGARKSVLNHYKNDEEFNSNHESAFDKQENYRPYTQTDNEHEQVRAYSPPLREPSAPQQTIETHTNQNYPQQDWENTNRQPQSRQEHILQQLSAIKENLVRRQRELASSMNAIPV